MLFLAPLAQMAFAEEGGQPQAITQALEQPGELAGILAEWRLYVVLALILTIALVALAYALGQGLSIPELKAWAEVELSEVFTTALLVIFIMGILLFVEQLAVGMIREYPMIEGACSAPGAGYCPAQVAIVYLKSYIDATGTVYEDVFKKNLEVSQEASYGQGIGISYEMYFFGGFNWKHNAHRMIDVEMYNEVLNLLGAIFSTLHAQVFLINFVTLKLAPIALIMGIVLRSFFVTRKLGGLLLAFGIGFLLVFPLMYALGWFTMDAAVYGISAVAGGPSSTCPAVCTEHSRIVMTQFEGESRLVSPEEMREAVYEDCIESLSNLDEEYREVICMDGCMGGYSSDCISLCEEGCRGIGLPSPEEYAAGCRGDCEIRCQEMGVRRPAGEFSTEEEIAAWDECVSSCVSDSDCSPPEVEEAWAACVDGCSARSGCLAEEEEIRDFCRERCPPAPGYEVDKEDHCRDVADAASPMLDLGTPGTPDAKSFMYCSQYPSSGSVLNELCGRLFDPEDPVYSQFDDTELYGCPDECRALYPGKPSYKAMHWYDYYAMQDQYYCNNRMCKEYKDPIPTLTTDERCERYGPVCPTQCMWVTTSGKTDPECPEICKNFMPMRSDGRTFMGAEEILSLWENNESQKTCVFIIPDIVFEEPDKCTGCIFVAEKGLTFKPQIIYDCTAICGGINAKTMGYENPATTSNSLEGFIGPTEIKSAAKLALPAFILPLLSLAVTFMFIITLSPMLGGDIDIPGMMRMMQ